MDLLGQLFKTIWPDLDLTQTLASLTEGLIVPPTVQPIAPVAQPVSVPPHTEDLTARSEAGSRGRTAEIKLTVMEEVEEYSAATTELEGEEEGNDEGEVSQPMENRDGVEKEQVTGLTEESEKADTTEAGQKEVVKTREVIPIEDDDVHMVTLEDVLATIVPSLPKRKRRLLIDEPKESEEDDDEEKRLLLEKKGKVLAGPEQKKIRSAS